MTRESLVKAEVLQQALKVHEYLESSAVELKHTSLTTPPSNPVAYPGGDGGNEGLITTLHLFDPTNSMAA